MEYKKLYGQILRKHHLFSNMSDEQLASLMQSALLVDLPRGKKLFMQGERAERFYFVISGKVKLFRLIPDGTEKIIELFGADQSFGVALMFKDIPEYPLTAQAVEATELISFSNQDYKALIREDGDLAFDLLGDLCDRLHGRLREIEMLSLKNSTSRVTRYFLNMLNENGAGEPVFELPVAKHMMAAQLSIQPETLSRIFNRMKEDRVVDIDGRKIKVLDLSALKNYE